MLVLAAGLAILQLFPENISVAKMTIPGERFEINLDGDGIDNSRSPSVGFVKDILERPNPTSGTPPSLPTVPTPSGFPAHKKRTSSTFKQRLNAPTKGSQHSNPGFRKATSHQESEEERMRKEKEEISQKNERRVKAMSEEEIEREKNELLATLSPKLIERLMERASARTESHSGQTFTTMQPIIEDGMTGIEHPTEGEISANDQQGEDDGLSPEDRAPKVPPICGESLLSRVTVHFPVPLKGPDIDPSSPEFLEQLHEKYFPNLPADPSKLSWMTPISDAEDKSYHPDEPLTASTIRFDFKGNILPPKTARELPVHLGLHHHADAPAAAGYTVPELAHLARSTFPAQRCMAMQTLGRILYRLGIGAYENEDITQGLWRCMKEGKVIETLGETAAGKRVTHMSVKVYATEALWNWQLGGGQRWKAE